MIFLQGYKPFKYSVMTMTIFSIFIGYNLVIWLSNMAEDIVS